MAAVLSLSQQDGFFSDSTLGKNAQVFRERNRQRIIEENVSLYQRIKQK
jgi:hypothetical protein